MLRRPQIGEMSLIGDALALCSSMWSVKSLNITAVGWKRFDSIIRIFPHYNMKASRWARAGFQKVPLGAWPAMQYRRLRTAVACIRAYLQRTCAHTSHWYYHGKFSLSVCHGTKLIQIRKWQGTLYSKRNYKKRIPNRARRKFHLLESENEGYQCCGS